MHIGINTLFHIPGEVGGTETYLLEILKAFDADGGDRRFTLFTNEDNASLLQSLFQGARWSFVHLNFSAKNRVARVLREQSELPVRAWKSKVDVMWSPGYTAPLVSACPQVVTIHDMQYKAFPNDLSVVARLTTDFLVQRAAAMANAIITVSEFSKEEVVRHTHATPDKVRVTLEAAASDFGRGPSTAVRIVNGPYILCVANTYPHKAVDQLVRAFGKLSPSIPHQLVLVGRPSRGEPELQKALRALPFPDRCLRLEGLSRTELSDLYSHASVFAFPSRYEGFGLPVLEALLAGTPVVTTRCGAIPEVGGNAVTYYDHNSDDDLAARLLETLSMSPLARAEMGRAGRSQAEHFGWQRTAQATLRILESVCATRGIASKEL